jgi:hypothetical protein
MGLIRFILFELLCIENNQTDFCLKRFGCFVNFVEFDFENIHLFA